MGANANLFTMSVCEILDFSVSVALVNKVSGFSFKLVVVYGSAYENGKQNFLDELEKIMSSWQGPIMVGSDFNLIRSINDKSNGIVNFKWMDLFNEWIEKWGLIELNPKNRKFTDVIMAKIDRVLVSTTWEAAFSLARVKALERLPSDHNPLLVDSGDNVFFGKKCFSVSAIKP